jgi:protein O-GlcNAc transferase
VTTHRVTPTSVQNAKIQHLLQEAAVHLQAGRYPVAARLCAQARALAPADFNTLFISGATALKQENYADAAEWLGRAHRRSRRSASCALRLGFALAKLGRYPQAEAALREALALAPADAEAWDVLGFVLKAGGSLEGAISAHQKAVELMPERALSWHNLGNALQFAGRFAEALAAHECARAADPSLVSAHFGRGLALQSCHRISEAVGAYGEALVLGPGHHEARSCRLMALNYLDGLGKEKVHAEHLMFGEALGAERRRAFPNPPEAGRRLRLAFLSPDLRAHSVAFFLEPLLAHLDREAFEIFLYHDHFVVDQVSGRLRSMAQRWRNFVGLPGDAVEAAIRADAPDVIVDLAGHTGLNRLPLFNRRLAPVQISYLGYPNTTGIRSMDYRFVDSTTDPVGDDDRFHTEKLVRFSSTAWSYAPPPEAPEPDSPGEGPGGPVTFGCFNNFAKVTDPTLAAWGRLLASVPGSRLRLKAAGFGEPSIAAQVRERLVRAGLDPSRVDTLARTAGMAEHLALYQGVDVALDTHPYNGTTTTCEALWMGVPVVTMLGDRHASRVGASLLTAAGHPEWIARDWSDYIGIAARLSRDRSDRRGTGIALRNDMRDSALLDHPGQAAQFARAVRECWASWCGRALVAA